MAPDAPDPDEDALMHPAATRLTAVSEHTETYPDGSPHITWSGGLADDGRYRLDGTETWRFPDGRKQYPVALEDPDIQALLQVVIEGGTVPQACIDCSEKYGVSDRLRALGCTVLGLGIPVSQAIQDGYVPMTW